MAQELIIKRYFEIGEQRWEKTKKDLQHLVQLINVSGGEYSLQLRENYFNIYYQGNSLAKVLPNKAGVYSVEIHRKFVPGSVLSKLERYSVNKPSIDDRGARRYIRFKVQPDNLHHFFRKSNIESLGSKIRHVHYGEEITFEQALITDNPPTEKFILIDRQVADHRSKAQIDLLALRRDSIDNPFHFQIIEVKLGRNEELYEKVGSQLNKYIEHIRENIQHYASCYERNYQQKYELGLIQKDLTTRIEIDRNDISVEGLIVSCGYSWLGVKAIEHLKHLISEKGWNIRVYQVPALKLP